MAAVVNGSSGAGDEDEDDGDYNPEEDDDDDGDDWFYQGTTTRAWSPPATTEPQETGLQLLAGGEFGYVGPKHRARPNHANVTRALLDAASKPSSSYTPKEEFTTVWLTHSSSEPYVDALQSLVPNTNGTTVATYDHNIYTAQFSDGRPFGTS